MRNPLVLAAMFALLTSPPAFAVPSTAWLNVPIGPMAVGTPVALTTGGGTSLDVTVTTGGSQGVNGFALDTLGVEETGLNYPQLRGIAIFNGGGSGSVLTTLTFANVHTGAAHARGLLMVGAINGGSSPVTVTSSVAGRVSTWSVVGHPFDFGPTNSYPVSWDAASGRIVTTAAEGNDSRCVVLDMGNLAGDGTVSITLGQYLNDGILFSLGEELTGTLGVPEQAEVAGLELSAPRPNPAHGVTQLAFSLPAAMHARLSAYDVSGRLLATLAEGTFAAGPHPVRWDTGARGGATPGGLVFLRLETPAGGRARRVLVLR